MGHSLSLRLAQACGACPYPTESWQGSSTRGSAGGVGQVLRAQLRDDPWIAGLSPSYEQSNSWSRELDDLWWNQVDILGYCWLKMVNMMV